jgi:hypothetical protein
MVHYPIQALVNAGIKEMPEIFSGFSAMDVISA